MFTSLGIAIFILVLALANLALGFAVAWYLRQVRVEIAWQSKVRDVQQEIAKVAAHAEETHAAKSATPAAAATNHATETGPATPPAEAIAKEKKPTPASAHPAENETTEPTPEASATDSVTVSEYASHDDSPETLELPATVAAGEVELALPSELDSALAQFRSEVHKQLPTESAPEKAAPADAEPSADLVKPEEVPVLSAWESAEPLESERPVRETVSEPAADDTNEASLAAAVLELQKEVHGAAGATEPSSAAVPQREAGTLGDLKEDLAAIAGMFGANVELESDEAGSSDSFADAAPVVGDFEEVALDDEAAGSGKSLLNDWAATLAENSEALEAALAGLRSDRAPTVAFRLEPRETTAAT